ncbi:MAG: dTDP-4-dehydrorhamnose reductase [Alphaproteobacteria bacterium]
MTLLVLGRGQVGRALDDAAAARGWPCVVLGHDTLDVTDAAAVASAVATQRPWAVVNAAAYTAVDRAESEPEQAMLVNGLAPGHVAAAAQTAGAICLHISTDYVFDGRKTVPYVEDDPVGPLGVYGKSKLAGERAVRAAGGRFLIVRTAWVFAASGQNFVKTMLRLGAERDALSVVDDQTGNPTAAADLADALLTMLDRARGEGFADWGVYHLAGEPPVTWFDFAQAIFAEAGMTVALSPTDTASFGAPAARPAHGVLDCARAKQVFGLAGIDWRAGLTPVVRSCRDS